MAKQFVDFLLDYRKKLNPILNRVFQDEKEIVNRITPIAGKMVDDYLEFVSGGGKLRGSEIYLGYKMFGGKNEKVGLLSSLVIEIVHSFLLIHDDIMDQDSLRRGKPTIHKKHALKKGAHYGISMAIDLGDEGMFFAYRILNSLSLPIERLSIASQFLSQVLMGVGIGQALDITYENEGSFTEDKVLQVHRHKTAEYTISGPLSLGAILAGADQKVLKALKDFGMPVGIAFQLRDDELGMFSTEATLGKPVDSDLRQGKVTILIVKALENAKGNDLKFLKYAHGNKNLIPDEVERVRQIMKDTGAFGYSQKLSRELVEDGKKFIPKITSDPKYQQLLSELADFVIERES